LPEDELVVGQVLVEGPNHPIAPGRKVAVDIGLVAVGISIARQIEPDIGHVFAVGGRGQEAVHQSFVSGGRAVRQERIALSQARGQAPQIEAQPTDERLAGRFGREAEMLAG
jgi:hypothetical protein